MLTMPTKFDDFKYRKDAVRGIFIELVGDSNTYRYGNMEMNLTDGHVYGLINSFSGLKQAMDIFRKSWTRAIVKVQLSNLPYKRDTSGNETRISNLVDEEFYGHVARIYLLNNPNATTASDCLKIFEGKVDRIDSYDKQSFSLTLEDNGDIVDSLVLQNSVNHYVDSHSVTDLPVENENIKLPVAYGRFKRYEGQPSLNSGLAKVVNLGHYKLTSGYWSSRNADVYVTSYHQFKDFDALYIPLDNNRVTVVEWQNAASNHTDVWIPEPVNPYTGIYDNVIYHLGPGHNFVGNPTTQVKFKLSPHICSTPLHYTLYNGFNKQNAVDDDYGGTTPYSDKTWLGLNTTAYRKLISLGAAPAHISYTVWDIEDIELFKSLWEDTDKNSNCFVAYQSAYILPSEYGSTHTASDLTSQWRMVFTDGPLGATTSNMWNHWHLFPENTSSGFSKYHTIVPENRSNVKYSYPIKYSDLGPGNGEKRDYALAWFGILKDHFDTPMMMVLGEVWLVIVHAFVPKEYAWAGIDGKKYSSDSVSMGVHSYTTSDFIQDSSQIVLDMILGAGQDPDDCQWVVEGVERDVGGGNVEHPGVLDAWIKTRINVTDEKTTVRQVIEQLSLQSLWQFFYSAAGKAQMFPLRRTNDATWWYSNLPKVRYDEIADGDIKIGTTDPEKVVNYLTVKSRWLPEEDRFADQDIYQNTYSQTRYGTRKATVEWENINSELGGATNNPMHAIACHLIDPYAGEIGGGLWSKTHTQIEFQIDGYSRSNWELGEWFEFDHATVDDHLKCGADSWSGKHFTVTGIEHNSKGVKITAVEIPDPPYVTEMLS